MDTDSGLPALELLFEGMRHARESLVPELRPREIGTVTSVSTGIATVSGLQGIGMEELIQFPGDVSGIAFNVDENEIGVVLLGDYTNIRAGDEVTRTGRVMDVAVGPELLGRVIDPLGRALDDRDPPSCTQRLPVEREAKAIMDRSPVVVPLQTGIKVIDALVPIGRGQRELILGDRQTGKTAIAVDTIVNQRDQNVICVYVAIGQRASSVAKVIADLRAHDAMPYTVVVVSEGSDAPGLNYIAPYAATSIAEYFMEAGRDVLVIYDDLTKHARTYREISLLLRRPPGREAFPGDIFYVHSRLLERSTHLCPQLGGGSLTALPIIETEAEDIAAYIPTNLISITDGQLYLSPTLFELGVLPAVDVGKSVSRVGSAAQRAVYRAEAGSLKLSYAQFEELEAFSRFGSRMDDQTQRIIRHGERIRECLKQPQLQSIPVLEQVALLRALRLGLLDRVALDRIADAEHTLRSAVRQMPEEIRRRCLANGKLEERDNAALDEAISKALDTFPPDSRP